MDQFLITFCLLASAVTSTVHSSVIRLKSEWEQNEEIQIFREYLRIPTVHPNIDYTPVVTFLEKQASRLELPLSVHYPVDDKNPVIVITWEGSQPGIPSIMLNSHMDVVPVYEEYWTHPPFGAEIDEKGDIHARGTQDTKCIGVQYLAAIRALKRQGIERLKRTIHVVFVPDEEVGGHKGIVGFVKTEKFKEMNIGFILDEGSAPLGEGMPLPAFYVEKIIWDFELIFHGQSGHGSALFNNTPGEKLNYVIGKLSEYREEEKKKWEQKNFPYGNVTSINLTMLKGGVQSNVIPADMSAVFDVRLSINTDLNEFKQHIIRLCEEAGGNITINSIITGVKQHPTPVDNSNPFWVAFKNGAEESGLEIEPTVMTGASDMRYIRILDIQAIGFAPMKNTVPKLHDHNEYLNAGVFLDGIESYIKIIKNLGNVDPFTIPFTNVA